MPKKGTSAGTKSVLAARLKLERERHGWSQSDLAGRIGTSQVNVSRWEKGLTVPGPYFRQQLASTFGKSLEELGLFIEPEEEVVSAVSASIPATPAHPAPLNTLPHHRNAFFTGRDDLLDMLAATLTSNRTAALTQAQAISGLGGIGKTQIAVEYAYRYSEHYQAIFWVTASSRDTLIADFVSLAELLNLPEKAERDQTLVVRAVKHWLTTTETRWLLILDNVDDLEVLSEFLPTRGIGDVLLTTRLQALGTIARGIDVTSMGPDEGLLFLLRRTQRLAPGASLHEVDPVEQAEAAQIVQELDGLPLALDQAGAYIEETQCGFAAYRELYKTRRKELLQHRGPFPITHPQSVAATWSLSFHRIEQNNPAAADLLRLLAFLHPEAIPEEILREGAAAFGPILAPLAGDALKLNALLGMLLRYSLLRRNPSARLLEMHRLVQAVLKDSMESSEQRLWAERTLRGVNLAFPDVEPQNWPRCQRVLPHAQICLRYLTEYQLVFPEAARLLNQVANYLRMHADYAQAEPLLLQALAMRRQLFDAMHPDIAETLNDLGTLYRIQGKYQQAEQLLLEARAIREQVLGLEHSATADTLNKLAMLSFALGKYRPTEVLYKQALEIRQKIFTPEHPELAKSQTGLAELYTEQGRYAEAEQLYQQALAMQEQAFGERHPDVARTLNNLALVYRRQAWYELAEQTYQRAFDIQMKVLREHHPDIAQTLYNLGRLYRARGFYREAEPFYQQALEMCLEIFGPDHPRVARVRYGLTKLYNSQGKYQQAVEQGQQALATQELRLVPDHPDIANTLGLLAQIFAAQQDFAKAETLNKRAIQIREQVTPMHLHIALLCNNLVKIYHDQEKDREAEPFIQRELVIRREILDPNHPHMAFTLTDQGRNFFLKRNYAQAERYFIEALAIREDRLGVEHPRTASTYHDLALLYHAQRCFTEAEARYQQALHIREKKLRFNHPDTIKNIEDYIRLLRDVGKEAQASEFEARVQKMKAPQAESDSEC